MRSVRPTLSSSRKKTYETREKKIGSISPRLKPHTNNVVSYTIVAYTVDHIYDIQHVKKNEHTLQWEATGKQSSTQKNPSGMRDFLK